MSFQQSQWMNASEILSFYLCLGGLKWECIFCFRLFTSFYSALLLQQLWSLFPQVHSIIGMAGCSCASGFSQWFCSAPYYWLKPGTVKKDCTAKKSTSHKSLSALWVFLCFSQDSSSQASATDSGGFNCLIGSLGSALYFSCCLTCFMQK